MRRIVCLACLVVLGGLAAPGSSRAEDDYGFPDSREITIAFAGDLLMHLPLTNAAQTATGEYDFDPLFQYIAPYLAGADYAIANLETRLAGAERGYSGYPCFNTPATLAASLHKAGIDLLGTANNHSLDKGYSGLVATLDNLDQAGLAHTGTYRDSAAQAKPCIVNVQGLNLAFLNYTYGTNGIPIPRDQPSCVNVIDAELLSAAAAAARQAGADYVIAFLHFGVEYERHPNKAQQQLARTLLDHGVDAVVGAHPHVVQPCEWYEPQAGGPARPIAYSLGNFASNQRSRYRDSGMIFYLTLSFDAGRVASVEMSYLPVYVRKYTAEGSLQYRVLPVHPDIRLTLEKPLSEAEGRRMDAVWDELYSHLALADGGGCPPLELSTLRGIEPAR
ncbi:CapA family protein [bacterium]|nr:CapA family protein [bacterium]